MDFAATPPTADPRDGARTVLYLRHGQAFNNVFKGRERRERLDINFDDAPLTRRGERHARAAARALAELTERLGPVDAVLVSTFTRTLQTGRLATEGFRANCPNVPVVALDDLRENWHHRRRARSELEAEFGDFVSDWALVPEEDPGLDPDLRRSWAPDGDGVPREPDAQVRDRQRRVLRWLFDHTRHRRVLVVGHSKYSGLLLGRTAAARRAGAPGPNRPVRGLQPTLGCVDPAVSREKLGLGEIRSFDLLPRYVRRSRL